VPKLRTSERDAFLREPGILMRIATIANDGRPQVTPIWFIFEDDCIYFTPRERSEWFANLKRDGRVALCIDEQPLPYRKVVLEGTAEMVHDLGSDDDWRDRYRRIARRYIPEDQAEEYVASTIDQPRALYRLALATASIRSWRMPTEGEPQHGIWHSRYYRDGSIMDGLAKTEANQETEPSK